MNLVFINRIITTKAVTTKQIETQPGPPTKRELKKNLNLKI